ncbi:FAD:protein FMN transferase [Enterococcus sp. LJL98]
MRQETQQVRLMGTIIDLSIEHENPGPILIEAIQRLKRYEKRFSANDVTSELMAINQAAGKTAVVVHPELFELIQIGKTHSCAQQSHLNIAIGPLVQTWRIGFSDARVPTEAEIQHLLAITDPRKIILDQEARTVYLKKAGMLLDLGCLAKGFIAELLITYLKEVGVKSALLNLGGNLVTFGPSPKHSDQYWRIGIQNPIKERKQSLIVLKTKNQSVVTSGIYERSLMHDSQQYHHILNPKTGYPIQTEVVSLTILSSNSCDGEIWTTRLFGKKPQEILEIVATLPEIYAFMITNTGETYYSKELENLIC